MVNRIRLNIGTMYAEAMPLHVSDGRMTAHVSLLRPMASCEANAEESLTKSGHNQLRQSMSLTEHHSALWLPFCRRSRLQQQCSLPQNAFTQDCCMDDVTWSYRTDSMELQVSVRSRHAVPCACLCE